MTPKQLTQFRIALQRLRAEGLETPAAKIEPNRTDAVSVGVADEDAQALSEMMQALASQRNRKQSERLREIDRALRKLGDAPDDFGMCEDCEEPIEAKRLSVMPYATLCAPCQAKHDPRRGETRRKITDYK